MFTPETGFQLAMVILAPIIAVILLAVVAIMALRGGRPFNFNATGFGVSIGFASSESQKPDPKEIEHGS